MSQTKTQLVEGLNINTSAPADALAVDSNGRVGIGASSPLGLFQVGNGTASVYTDAYINGATTANYGPRFGLVHGGTGIFEIANAGRINGGTSSDTYATTIGSNNLQLGTNRTVALHIDTSQRVGIGTTSPGTKLHVNPASDVTTDGLRVQRSANSTQFLLLNYFDGNGQIAAVDNSGNNFPILRFTRSTDNSTFTESMRIDPSGRLLVGTSSTLAGVTDSLLQIRGNSSGSNFAGKIALAADTSAAGTVSGTDLGAIYFGNVANGIAGLIECKADEQWGTNDYPGRLMFSTTANGASSPTERMRISNSGNIIVNFDGSSQTGTFRIADGTAALPGLTFWADGGADTGIYRPGANILGFSTGGTERMRIRADGTTWFNTTSAGSGNSTGTYRLYQVGGLNTIVAEQNQGSGYNFVSNAQSNGGTYAHMIFLQAGTAVGQITSTGSTTTYSTSSDYRIKENVTLLSGAIDRLSQINVHRFNFVDYPEKTVDGFIAHEVQTVVPEAVVGEKDAVDDEGNPVYQGIDQSKLVPLLTAALQEAIAKIETLEANNIALEARLAALEAN